MSNEMLQIGVTALRGNVGEFLPSVPLFINPEDASLVTTKGGVSSWSDTDVDSLGRKIFKKLKAWEKEQESEREILTGLGGGYNDR